MRAAMVYPKMSTHVRLLSKLHSLEPSVVICIVATFGMILGRVLLDKLIFGYNHF